MGLAVKASSFCAYNKLIEVKNRPMNKAFPFIVGSKKDIEKYAYIDEITKKIREASALRNDNSTKVLSEVSRQVGDAALIMEEGFNSSTDKGKLLDTLAVAEDTLRRIKVRPELEPEKQTLQKKITETISEVSNSSNYKINQINSGIDKKSKKILSIVSDILSQKLSKQLVDDILDEIIKILNRK